ncbi:MAG: hypothetical protein M0038_13405, partial [Pseudomonadota bacterium]|nr:hypothetical protein [Pseudomonadota bacterium]
WVGADDRSPRRYLVAVDEKGDIVAGIGLVYLYRYTALRAVGLSLAACEKTVQIVYERQMRPSEKQYEPWLQRVTEQLRAAYRALEAETPVLGAAPKLTAATIGAAVSWRFTQEKVPEALEAQAHPRLRALSEWAEAQPEFLAAPFDDTTLHL